MVIDFKRKQNHVLFPHEGNQVSKEKTQDSLFRKLFSIVLKFFILRSRRYRMQDHEVSRFFIRVLI